MSYAAIVKKTIVEDTDLYALERGPEPIDDIPVPNEPPSSPPSTPSLPLVDASVSSRTEDRPMRKDKDGRRKSNIPRRYRYVLTDLNESILKTRYVAQTRPYSQLELTHLHATQNFQLFLSRFRVTHTECGHSYYVKTNGQKYREIQEKNETENVGNCSVCWKLRRTPVELKPAARFFIHKYQAVLKAHDDNNYLEYPDLQVEKVFNTWLYFELYEQPLRNDRE